MNNGKKNIIFVVSEPMIPYVISFLCVFSDGQKGIIFICFLCVFSNGKKEIIFITSILPYIISFIWVFSDGKKGTTFVVSDPTIPYWSIDMLVN